MASCTRACAGMSCGLGGYMSLVGEINSTIYILACTIIICIVLLLYYKSMTKGLGSFDAAFGTRATKANDPTLQQPALSLGLKLIHDLLCHREACKNTSQVSPPLKPSPHPSAARQKREQCIDERNHQILTRHDDGCPFFQFPPKNGFKTSAIHNNTHCC